MRLSDLAKGSSVLLGVIVAGYLSTIYVDQRLAAPPSDGELAPLSDEQPGAAVRRCRTAAGRTGRGRTSRRCRRSAV